MYILFSYSSNEKVEIYYPKPPCTRCETSHSPGKDSLLVKVNAPNIRVNF